MGLLKMRQLLLNKLILEIFKPTHNNRQVSSLDVDGETDTVANEREEEFRMLAVP